MQPRQLIRVKVCLCVGVMSILALSCASTQSLQPTVEYKTTVSLQPTIEYRATASHDCDWYTNVIVWRDDNRNGVSDPGEPFLSDVAVYTDDIYNHYNRVGMAMSDAHGVANQHVSLPGCPKTEFEVFAEPPAGYTPTTPLRMNAAGWSADRVIRFGFAYSLSVTPTPGHVAQVNCTQFYVGSSQINAIAVAADGAIWAAPDAHRISRIDPKTAQRKDYNLDSGTASESAAGIAIDSDGAVWLGTSGGASRLDGDTWTHFHQNDGLMDDRVYAVATTPDKSVWFVTHEGISQYRSATSAWVAYRDAANLDFVSSSRFHVAKDGSLWLVTDSSIYHIQPTSNSQGQWDWTSYKESFADGKSPLYRINGSAIASDDTLWFAASNATKGAVIAHLIPQTGQWIIYDSQTTNGALILNTAEDIAVATDDSVWIATWNRGIMRLVPGSDATHGNTWVFLRAANGLTGDEVRRVSALPNGDMLITFRDDTSKCHLVTN